MNENYRGVRYPAGAADRNRPGRGTALVCMLGLGIWLAPSQSLEAGEVSIHGFGTLGLAYLDRPQGWAYTRSLNQRTSEAQFRADLDSVVGLQVNYSPTPGFELVGQAAVSALDGDAKPADYLELAFLAWRPGTDWSLRLGRVNLDAYLISDHRDVGFTYAFIRPPVEFYSRMPTSLDGGDISRTWVVGDVQWQAKLYAGHTSAGIGAGRLKLWPLYGVMLARESDGLLLRISALRARSKSDIEALGPLLDGLRQMQLLPVPQVAADAQQMEAALQTRGLHTSYLAAAAAYDRNNWLLSAEVNRAKARDASAISFTTGYVSLGRRFGPFSTFVMQSAAVRDDDTFAAPDWQSLLTPIDPLLAQQAQGLANGATTAINRTAGHQFTTSIGLRWDVAPRLALKAQWDHVRTRSSGDGLWHEASALPARSDILAVAADFVF